MNETTACPSCRRTLRIPENLLGQEVKCPACGTVFVATVESPPGGPAPARSEAPAEPAREPAPRERDRERDRDPDRDRPRTPRNRRRDEDLDRDLVRRRRSRFEDEDEDDRPRRRRYEPHRGAMILAFGLCSILISPVPFGQIAWWMGANDLAKIRAGEMDPEGEGLTQAGRIIGMIMTILVGVGLLFFCLIMGLIIAAAATH